MRVADRGQGAVHQCCIAYAGGEALSDNLSSLRACIPRLREDGGRRMYDAHRRLVLDILGTDDVARIEEAISAFRDEHLGPP